MEEKKRGLRADPWRQNVEGKGRGRGPMREVKEEELVSREARQYSVVEAKRWRRQETKTQEKATWRLWRPWRAICVGFWDTALLERV